MFILETSRDGEEPFKLGEFQTIEDCDKFIVDTDANFAIWESLGYPVLLDTDPLAHWEGADLVVRNTETNEVLLWEDAGKWVKLS